MSLETNGYCTSHLNDTRRILQYLKALRSDVKDSHLRATTEEAGSAHAKAILQMMDKNLKLMEQELQEFDRLVVQKHYE